MKKALLSLLLVAACTTFAMAQHVKRDTVAACQTYTWAITGQTYTNDTVVVSMNQTFDTIYVLNLTINTPYVSHDTIVSEACSYIWHNDTIRFTQDCHVVDSAIDGSGLCDSTFNAHIIIPLSVYDTTVAVACVRYFWGDDTTALTTTGYYYDTVGDVPVYGLPGLMNDNGCRNIHVLDLTVNPNHIITDTMEACNASYSWRNMTLTATGDYIDTVPALDSICDTLYTMNFTLVDHKSVAETMENCGDYSWHTRTLTTTGIYTDTVVNETCDTIYTLDLTINNYQNTYDTVENCGRYIFGNDTLLATGSYIDTVLNAQTNCNTIRNLELRIVVDTVAQTAEACGEKEWNYTRGIRTTQMTDTIRTTGFYSHLVVDTVSQCVTFSSMDATIRQPRQGYKNDTITACNVYYLKFTSINGKNDRYFYETIEFDTVLADHRLSMCNDSNIHLSITIHKSNRDTISRKACDKFYWNLNEKTYTKTPEKAPVAYYGSDSNGCDSITTLMLTIKKSPVISAINGEWNLTAGDTAILYPTCTGNPVYTWSYNGQTSHADTLIIPNVQGNFDVTLMADVTNTDVDLVCSDTSWISIVTYVGIDGATTPNVSLYPNPTVGQLNIESAENVQEVAIFNTIGQQVAVKSNLGTQYTMNLSNLSKGTYTMRLLLQNGETITRKFVITK